MKYLNRTAFSAFSVLFSACLVHWVMGSPAGQQPRGPVIRTTVEVVNLLCTVQDKRGRYADDLRREDFQIYEDGVLQDIDFFNYASGEDAQPLVVVLAIDTSGSVKNKLEFEKQVASEFLRDTLRANKDMAAVIQFDSEINLVQDFTFDLELLRKNIESIRAGGATKLYDAIWVAVEYKFRDQVGRKVLVILSDGEDTQSVETEDSAIRAAQEEDVLIFGIGVRDRDAANFAQLQRFARSTGGAFFKSNLSLERLRDAFRKINQEIKNQYSIGYVSKNPVKDGSFRNIEVKVAKRNLRVRHRRGYYSPNETGADR